MKGMSLDEFMDKVSWGLEIEFKVTGSDRSYLIQGYKENNLYYLTIDYWDKNDNPGLNHDYMYFEASKSIEDRLRKFEEAKIFNGKTIYEIEADVEVICG